MTTNVDLGQLIIAGVITGFGWLITTRVASFEKKLLKHEDLIIGLVGNVQKLIGFQEGLGWSGEERRK